MNDMLVMTIILNNDDGVVSAAAATQSCDVL